MKKQITIDGEKMYVDGREVVFKEEEEWEPKNGKWLVTNSGTIGYSDFKLRDCTSFGATHKTQEQAEKARDAMRRFNRLLAYKMEFAPDWEPDWEDEEQENFFVYYNNKAREWRTDCNHLCENVQVYFPEDVAKELADKLNKGIVKL